MKILRIIARLNVGGPARHVVWLTKKLRAKGFDTVLVTGSVPPGEEDMAWFAAENGVEPYVIPEMSRELSIRDIISLAKVYREMRRVRPDIIHTHTAKAGTIGRTAAFFYKWLTFGIAIGRPRRVHIVHTFHGHVFHSYYGRAKTQFFLFIERVLAHIATDRILVLSRQQLQEINGRFGIGNTSKFRIVPLGIDLDPFKEQTSKRAAARTAFGAKEGDLVIGFTGRLTEIKDIPLLINAFAKALAADDAPPLKLAIVGDGALRPSLESLAAELDLGERITFLGNRTDVFELLAGFDMLALSSLNEGTPLSMIEAMAAGLPVVATAVGGVTDLLGEATEHHDGFDVCERGIAVRGRETADFAKGLIYMAKSAKLQSLLSNSGREFATKNYSVDRLVADVEAIYRDLLPQASDAN